ncbi:MAG: 3'-5' exonuclease domain-containing protein 2 [Magnetococcales bacterium]|nr:3'-5' exonuclease domain-containing protein 2 [Magnetococcales bacterium]
MGLPPKFACDISKEEINRLPVRRWEGAVHLVQSSEQMAAVAPALWREKVLGFDTETKPVFKKGVTHKPSLIQLATSEAVYLFQLNRMKDYSQLIQLFESSEILKVGVGLDGDTRDLQDVFAFEHSAFVDIGETARERGLNKTGLRNMAARFFSIRISKRAQCSNWARWDLKDYQITYAATDAWISREIYLLMHKLGFFNEAPENADAQKSHPS